MKYLFFDCEFATSTGGSEKICEFGYVVTDELFNVLYKGNFIINPNIGRKEWDWWALQNILTRKREAYEKQYNFPAFYDKIVSLLKDADYIFGYNISADAHALNCEFNRYNLPFVDFNFYDIEEMYKTYSTAKKVTSLEKMLEELGIFSGATLHDAECDAYNTMLGFKTILEKLNKKAEDLIKLCPGAKDRTFNGLIESREKVKNKKSTNNW